MHDHPIEGRPILWPSACHEKQAPDPTVWAFGNILIQVCDHVIEVIVVEAGGNCLEHGIDNVLAPTCH
jgi:hypothetical protein